ncbi:Metalloenzyme, LuxS/M16 peptidase-like protein [Cladochytrium replicatum]|nr:Metalloenzyme, LuxS/M16 peptidase-like protein [Cladochytrium replicatum]
MTHNKSYIATDTDAILRPDLDNRQYRHIVLENGLKALVISDLDTDKSAAAADVRVGHLCDPDEAPGLAHFCEHMLFLGTEKYPSENAYSQFLSEHDGRSNAYTGVDDTNYYFSVSADFLEPALDRFAQFFVSPLFNDSATERELNAVDSEHKRNLQSDGWRLFQLEKDLSEPTHPYIKFATGNHQTLRDDPKAAGFDIRNALLEFHDKYYSSNITRVAVLGKEPIDVLTNWVVEKFSPVKNLSIEPPSFGGHPLTSSQLLTKILAKPVQDMRHIELTFPFPDTTSLYKSQPERYLSHLIGHESEGSILSKLKKLGWAVSLSAGATTAGINFGFFKVSIDLTEAGEEHYEDVIVLVFQYIEMMKEAGIQKWIFDETQALSVMHFRFSEKSNPASYVSRMASLMQRYDKAPPKDVLSAGYVVEEYDPESIKKYLDILRPDNFRVFLVSPSVAQRRSDPDGPWEKAKYYGTEYVVDPLGSTLKERLAKLQSDADLHLPKPNVFIPTRFDVRKLEASESIPRATIIRETPTLRLWHKKDDTYYVPKASAAFRLKTPQAYVSPYARAATDLYLDIVKDSLMEYTYYADCGGLSYDITLDTSGLGLSVTGYNDKLPILLAKLASVLAPGGTKIDPVRFAYLKEDLIRSYKNWEMRGPEKHATYYVSYFIQERLWTREEALRELEGIKPEDLEAFVPTLLSHMYIEGLVHGNVEREEAVRLGDILEVELKPKPLPIALRFTQLRSHVIPTGMSLIYERPVPNPENVNSAIEYYLQLGEYTDQDVRIKAGLVAQILNEPCFDQLRTKEQLGYLVWSTLRQLTGICGFRVVIESERDPLYLEARIEAFLEKARNDIAEMSSEAYAKHQNALVARLTEKDKNLQQTSSTLYSHIMSGYYNFDQDNEDSKLVPGVSKAELLAFYDAHIAVSSALRRKLSTHIRSTKIQKEDALNGADEDTTRRGEDVKTRNVLLTSEEEVQQVKLGLELGKGAFPGKEMKEYMAVHDPSLSVLCPSCFLFEATRLFPYSDISS